MIQMSVLTTYIMFSWTNEVKYHIFLVEIMLSGAMRLAAGNSNLNNCCCAKPRGAFVGAGVRALHSITSFFLAKRK